MKVIFLDFDGVLNSEKYVRNSSEYGVVIDPTRMRLLKQIIDETGANIVLSTSWREHWETNSFECNDTGKQINAIFDEYGLKISDKTPKLHLRREQEIQEWLNEHPEVENYVVLDDMFLGAEFLEGHFVKTSNCFNGLDETDVKRTIEILNS